MKKLLQMPVVLYWWNFRKKTKDFEGTLFDALQCKGIKLVRDGKNIRFQFAISNHVITILTKGACETQYTAESASIDVLKQFLTLLGDKALINDHRYGRQYRINH